MEPTPRSKYALHYNLDLLSQTADSNHSAYPLTQILTLQVDIASEDAIRCIITQAVDKYDTINYAVNNAGRGGRADTSHALSSSHFDLLNKNCTKVYFGRTLKRHNPTTPQISP
ncbi:hypothetical protein G7K_1233-t1 [Saitoella complicata NRRL Y-17804]|uniref:Ketoreductase (KR) domain-containing protein n=1 Tax=Saitoella complicata (strain BCRC 22490 / CBS 7301 / JCM 7358 / NBRC 10748 / NRRL Y-17804) TaxID=698492 RepID=A0A0E9NB08_SAICN|nr:hypothetical protein G7K_1233-t1 [Saitoella complicata NRRL Y-17804]